MKVHINNDSTTRILILDNVLPIELYQHLLDSFPIAACLSKAKSSRVSQGLISCETSYGQFLAETCSGYSEALRFFSSQDFVNLLFENLKDQITSNQNILNFLRRTNSIQSKTYIAVDDSTEQDRLWGWSNDIASSVERINNLDDSRIPLKGKCTFSVMHGPHTLPPHTDVSRKVISGLLHLPFPIQHNLPTLGTTFYSRKSSQSLHQQQSTQILDKSQLEIFNSCYEPVNIPYCYNRAVFFSRSSESWHSYDSSKDYSNLLPRRSLMLNYYFVN